MPIPSVNNKSVQDDNRSHLNAEQSNGKNFVFNTEAMIEVASLKEKVNCNSRTIEKLQKQCSRGQILNDLGDIRSSITTLQSIINSPLPLANFEWNNLPLTAKTNNLTKNNASSKGDESLITPECKRIESSCEHLCFNLNTHANTEDNNCLKCCDESLIASECIPKDDVFDDVSCLIVKTHDTVKSNNSPECDGSLVTEECLLLGNCPHKSSQQRDESSISMTNQLIEEFCPSVKTDVNNNTAGELSRSKYENALLQKNVSALRDENHLLRDTSELLTSELEKRTRKPGGWNSPQIAYSELQINPQLEAISLPPHSQPHIKNAEWRDYLNLVHCVTSSQTAQPKKSDDTPKSPQYTNNGGPDMPNRSMHGGVDKLLYPGLSAREHNQRQPIPTRITLRTTSMNRRKRKQNKLRRNEQGNRNKFFRSRPLYHQTDWMKVQHEWTNWYNYYY